METIMASMRTYDSTLSMAGRMNDLTKNDNNFPSCIISLLIIVIYIAVVLHYRGETQLYTGEPAPSAAAMGKKIYLE